ncbi:MAG TPA: single-stranded-DNA-specific exonuclease RecJ [Pseudomonadales bacterium]|nr:single-stranded-DNA-specific exonuclease RecJ [Pseudomonadales bacterium]
MSPVLARIFSHRGISNAAELDYRLERLPSPDTLKGLPAALTLLVDSLQQQQRILVVGDFDADGATSTAVALRGLRALGAQHVDFLVPNRFTYGYGLTPGIVALACERKPDLIITVDNGISSIEGIAAAKKAGIKILITDHHLPGELLPAADAIVNPNQPGCEFPDKSLAGVGVMFYVLLALRKQLRDIGWFAVNNIAEPNFANLLDLVALGTVADVVPLSHANRILVQQGLLRIRTGKCCEGIKALAMVAKKELPRLVAADFGFGLAPRINAAGRLDDMSHGIACLLTDDPQLAQQYARELDNMNLERRLIEGDMQETALNDPRFLRWNESEVLPWSLCLYDSSWHQGVIGILAGRLKEKFHRPAIVFADANDDEIKGSARSVSGLHIRDALDSIAARHPHILSKFGGHAMAAGLTLRREHFEPFCELFEQEVQLWLDETDLEAVLVSDGELSAQELNLELAEQLRAAGPWGQRFPEPLFDGVFVVKSQRIVGEKHLKLRLGLPADESRQIEAIAFNVDTAIWPDPAVTHVRLAYRLDVNEYNGLRSAQLLVQHIVAI